MQPLRPYCRGVLRGVASVSAQARWECVLLSADGPPPAIDLVGFIHGAIGHFAEQALPQRVERGRVPAVDISPAHRQPRLPLVSTDDVAVGRMAAAHLLSLGLPHFAFFGSRGDYCSLLREQGFKHAVGAAGLSCLVFHNGDRVAHAPAPRGTPRRAGRGAPRPGSRAAGPAGGARDDPLEDWVRRLPKPVGIMAATDHLALDLLATCRKVGVDVPRSAAIVGVDNDEVFCELSNPTLSSVALSTQRIGYEAARMLERLMAGEPPARALLLVPPAGVVPRGSSDLPSILDPDVAAAVRYISLHVQDRLQVADVLREVPVSRRSLEQRFRRALGRTPAAEIRRAQVEVAKQLLAETDEAMSAIARAAGFSNAKQLGAGFLRETGITPSAHRRRYRS